MKQVYYILLILLSIISCSQDVKYKKEVTPTKETSVVEPYNKAKNKALEDNNNLKKVKSKNTDSKKFIAAEVIEDKLTDKKVAKQKNALTTEIKAVFDESAVQKLQQLFDIAVLTENNKQSSEMKAYAKASAKNYYADSKKNIDSELKAINAIKADSIVVKKLIKKSVKHLKDNYYKISYSATVNYYKQEKFVQSKKQLVDFQFEIVKLNLDGHLFSTIESKILRVK